jgi:hypothetical protein
MDQNFLKINIIFRFFWPKILVGGVGNIANPKGLRTALGFRYLLQMYTVTPSGVQVASGTEILEIAFTFHLICSS